MVKLFSDFLDHCLEFVRRAQDLGLGMDQINLVHRLVRNLLFDDRPGMYERLNDHLDATYNQLDTSSAVPSTQILYDVIDVVDAEIERDRTTRRNSLLKAAAPPNGSLTPPPGRLTRSVSLLSERNTSLTGSTHSLAGNCSAPRPRRRRSFVSSPAATTTEARDLERKRNFRLRMAHVDTRMSAQQIDSLLVRPLVERGSSSATERCHMCGDVVTFRDELASLPCGHQLDRKCLESRVGPTAECPFCLRIV